MHAPQLSRRHDIDWLRVFATYLLLLFHVAMVFNPAPFFHIRNHDVAFPFLIVCGFISLWHMPLFFLLAGWSIHSSVSTRTATEFLRERFFRLCVPLVAGCVLMMPAIKFFELSSGLDANYTGLYIVPELQSGFRQVIPSGLPTRAAFDEGFLAFLPTFFTDLTRFTWAHLWFVAYLLTFTVLYLPLFLRLRRDSGRFAGRIAGLWIYLPILPLAIIQITMRERWPGLQNLIDDWANFAYYSTYLIAGYLLARFPVLEDAAHRECKRAFVIAISATVVLLLGVLRVFDSPSILLAHTAIAGWCYVISLMGWAHQRLSFRTPRLGYLTESAFPVYLLHQAAIVVPGFFVIQLPLGSYAKFLILLLVATAVTLSTYHFAVRPFALARFLCGMKSTGVKGTRGRVAAGVTATALLAVALAVPQTAAPTAATALVDDPRVLGLWYIEGGAAQVEITECNGQLCGRVAWLRSPFDENGCPMRDRHNPNEVLRERPVLGLEVLRGLGPAARPQDGWDGGAIYDPDSGRTYRASATLIDPNRLALRGYVGIPLLGRTTTWLRVGAEAEMCAKAG